MADVVVRVFHETGSHDSQLVKTLRIATASDKPLTGERAKSILRRALPGFERPLVTRTPAGWRAARALAPSDGCAYHFTWEVVLLSDDA